MMNMSPLLLALAIPLFGAVGIALAHRLPNVRETVTLATAGLLFLSVASLLPAVLAGERRHDVVPPELAHGAVQQRQL